MLQEYGQENDGAEEKDYLLVDDNLGWYKHRIEANRLELAQPVVVKSLQKLLIEYPNWEIRRCTRQKVWRACHPRR